MPTHFLWSSGRFLTTCSGLLASLIDARLMEAIRARGESFLVETGDTTTLSMVNHPMMRTNLSYAQYSGRHMVVS